jgi:SAM-dependent methyltransferase
MPDVYASILDSDPAMQARLADILELRAADPQQQAMLDDYVSRIEFPPSATVLEIGCGTGAVTRALAQRDGVTSAIGVDPSPVFVTRARELGTTIHNLTFEEGDGRSLRFADDAFDTVVLHTTLCHVPQPEHVLSEAARVLHRGGTLAVFDGDYATTTVALAPSDPLQDCIEAAKAAFIHDVWLIRRLPALLTAAGFEVTETRSHGYLQTSDPAYMLTLVDRGADALAAGPGGSPELADALKADARRRVEAGSFFGFIGFVSILARL